MSKNQRFKSKLVTRLSLYSLSLTPILACGDYYSGGVLFSPLTKSWELKTANYNADNLLLDMQSLGDDSLLGSRPEEWGIVGSPVSPQLHIAL